MSKPISTLVTILFLLGSTLGWLHAGNAKALGMAAGWTPDRQLLELSDAVPGFGGLFYDADGTLTVYLRDLDQQHLLAFDEGVRVLPGAYDFRQLHELLYQRLLPRVQSVPGVVFTDLDEARNRVVIGVATPTARQQVEATLGAPGIDRGAVIVEDASPVLFAQELSDLFDQPLGGIEITTAGIPCSLGFNATWNGLSGFVTNSHCTDDFGMAIRSEFHQPAPEVAPELIALEWFDLDFFAGGACPAGNICRHSDSAFVLYKDSVEEDFGRIARTTFDDPSSGSKTIDPLNPSFDIVAEASDSIVGLMIHKVGRTTGWTRGPLAKTCVNTNVDFTPITFLCQSWVDAGVLGGDSGSPVFSRLDETTVQLEGILWGRNEAGTSFVYSPMPQIEQDLGSLVTF